MNSKGLLLSELYSSVVIQGEGMVCGVPTLFVRCGGCDYACGRSSVSGEFDLPFVCDTLYSVLPRYRTEWFWKQPQEIVDHINQVTNGTPILVTLSGGNPALQDCGELIDLGHRDGHTFSIETQGTKLPEWARILDSITISPKPPSSGMVTNWDLLEKWVEMGPPVDNICLKVVIFDDDDFEYARLVRRLGKNYGVSMFLQAGTSTPYTDTSTPEHLALFRDTILSRTAWLGERVIESGWFDVRVLPQVHALINGSRRGV